ncbi:hypothetical protein [Roseospira goensis]|uniref:Uncharacterized protein n=1 Tax=Roseospira goensis TaxID=391922 RepID=A0A7W6RYI0_9PROT|nr:hypothetical protein [Roseospira goensis]MBB4285574.1 hypothetical protein [Roseospira goensis]
MSSIDEITFGPALDASIFAYESRQGAFAEAVAAELTSQMLDVAFDDGTGGFDARP